MITKDLGAVTAYAEAVEAGYTGTEEEYAALLASYATVAQNAAASASAAATSATAAAGSATSAAASASEASTTVSGAITNIEAAGTAQVGLVTAEGTTQIGLVSAEGAAQVSAVDAKGAEVIESIPEDYTELSADVTQLKSDLKNGNINTNALELTKIKGITGVTQYRYNIIKNKTIGVSGGTVKILDSDTDNVYLFERGLGWIVNATTWSLILDKNTLQKISNGKGPALPKNLSQITADTLYAICETGFDCLNFDFTSDDMFPYTPKDITLIPKTLFGTSLTTSGINSYNTVFKCFAPFRLNGTVKTSGITGAVYYNNDGSVGEPISVVNNSVTADGKIVVLFSNDIDNASISFPKNSYEYTGKQCSVFGDSLTADAAYYPFLAELTGLNIKNCGQGGTTVAGTGENCFWRDVRINALDGDFIVIMGGSNDAVSGIQSGEMSLDNYDTNTFVGAYNVALSKIYYRYKISEGYYSAVDYSGVTRLEESKLPNIILVTPPKLFTSQTNYENTQRFGGYVKEIGKWWGLPIVDAWENMQMSWISEGYYFSTTDKTHYNEHGRSKLASLIAEKFNECFANFDNQ